MRELYNLSHFSHRVGKIGRLQTLATIPVLPGDSIDIAMDGVIRLSPHRRESVQECQVDHFAFFVPHRHIYGADNWRLFLKQGYDAVGTGLAGYSISSTIRDAYYLGVPSLSAATPKWLIDGYNWIWDQYFRIPFLPSDANMTTYPSGGVGTESEQWRRYGRLIARLDHPLNNAARVNSGGTISWRDLSDDDSDVPISGGEFDIRDLERIKAEYASEIEATWFADRYRDIMAQKWGTKVNIDADQRPELLMHEEFLLSGGDVDGADDATLGMFTGKTVGASGMFMPRKYFEEHGTLWLMSAVRFPLIHQREAHPLTQTDVTYLNTIADPRQFAGRSPEGEVWLRWLAPVTAPGAASTEYLSPYGQHWRLQPNCVHPDLTQGAGYPWFLTEDNTGAAYYYHAGSDYDGVFQSQQFAHWQMHHRLKVNAVRHVPKAANSIFVGA